MLTTYYYFLNINVTRTFTFKYQLLYWSYFQLNTYIIHLSLASRSATFIASYLLSKSSGLSNSHPPPSALYIETRDVAEAISLKANAFSETNKVFSALR